MRFLIILAVIIVSGCTSDTREEILSEDASGQKRSYFEIKKRLDLDSEDNGPKKMLENVEHSMVVNMGSDDGVRSRNVVIPAKTMVWVVYPYQDRLGIKHNMTEVEVIVSPTQWYSDHGPRINKEGLGSEKIVPFFHRRSVGESK